MRVAVLLAAYSVLLSLFAISGSPGSTQDKQRELNDAGGAADGPIITILTGTHAIPAHEALLSNSQSKVCQAVNLELRNAWSVFSECRLYTKARKKLLAALSLLDKNDRCTLGSTPKGYLFTFPHATKTDAKCDSQTRNLINKGTYAEFGHKVLVPWFLIRPDLVTLEKLALKAGVRMRVLATIGHDIGTAAFGTEGCPRIRTVTANRDIYQQQLLQVMLSDLRHQIDLLKNADVIINVCEDSIKLLESQDGELARSSQHSYFSWPNKSKQRFKFLSQPNKDPLFKCQRSPERSIELNRDSHVPSMLALDWFHHGKVLKKSVWATPENGKRKLVFIAGLEGVGHHMFSVLGKKHTTRELYEALREYLSVSSWRDDSWEDYGRSRNELVQAMRDLRTQTAELDDSNVFFLNTVFSEQSVNMYSMPWGGPRCYLKRFARIMCNIDILEIAKMAEEADIDLRIVVLKRSLGASIVSASVNRNFGTIISQSRILGMSWSLLRESLQTIDPAFYATLSYEDMLQKPVESTEKLNSLIGLDADHPLAQHFNATMFESNREYGHKNVHSWKRKLDRDQFEFIADIVNFSDEQREDFEVLS